ncbi:hypothetical protein [Haloparvum sedimenti]|uniref:hypothetical protein n=1 Tax=Haloparvum sedimenti TaxID=1678448 RepID=UPI00071E6A03|nr:hypothetical protein [Haloparvum sedimenti]
MNLAFAAGSGYGKSWGAQAVTEKNLHNYGRVLVLDYKGEFRGLVSKDHGPAPCKHWIAGPREQQFGAAEWRQLLEANEKLVLERHQQQTTNDEWRQICAKAIAVARQLGDVLIVIDEAHFVAPQTGKVPDAIKGLATTGRGEGVSSIWVTQRPSELEETVWGNCQARILGGFNSDNDLKKIKGVVEYPEEVHKPGGNPLPALHDDLLADGEPVSLRKRTTVADDGTERVSNSEWVYSDNDGDVERFWSSDRWSPECDHVGSAGKKIEI